MPRSSVAKHRRVPAPPAARRRPAARAMLRVPEITAYFWIIQAMSTALGESTSDYLVHRLPPVLAVLLGFVAFVAALAVQFAMRRYVAWAYWSVTAFSLGTFKMAARSRKRFAYSLRKWRAA